MNVMLNTGKSGLRAYQYDLDVIAHNVANVGTVGYKSTKTSFQDLIFSSMDINKNRYKTPENQELTGRGIKAMGQNLKFQQGVVTMSEYDLDYAITGDALFMVDYKGSTMFTRNGSFDISVEADADYLVTNDGGYVLDWNGDRITIPFEDRSNSKVDHERLDGQIGMFTFENPNGLMRRDNTRFIQTGNSGDPRRAVPGVENELLNGYLERSITDLSQEMTQLILSQRAYQFSARIVTTADQMEDEVNQLRN